MVEYVNTWALSRPLDLRNVLALGRPLDRPGEAEENFLREAKKIRGDKREVRSYHTVSKWSRTWWGCTTDAIAAADFNISSSCFSEWWNDEWWTCCRCWRSTPTNCRGPSSAGAGPISLGGSPSTDGSPPTAGEVPGGPHRGRSPFLAALRGGGHVSAQRLTFSFLDFSWGDEVQPIAAWDGWFCLSIAARQQGGVVGWTVRDLTLQIEKCN